LDDTDAILERCSDHFKPRLQEVQQEVVERWEELRLTIDQREVELKVAGQRYNFLNTVRSLIYVIHMSPFLSPYQLSFPKSL